jgi:hypothetical protein
LFILFQVSTTPKQKGKRIPTPLFILFDISPTQRENIHSFCLFCIRSQQITTQKEKHTTPLFIISQIPNYPKEKKEQLLCLFFSTSQQPKQKKKEKKTHSLCLFLSLLRHTQKQASFL